MFADASAPGESTVALFASAGYKDTVSEAVPRLANDIGCKRDENKGRSEMTNNEKTKSERFTVSGSQLVEKIKQLIHGGNIRKVRLIHKEKIIFEIPLTIGAPAAAAVVLAAPILAALGAFAALVTECTIEVEKTEKSD